MKTQKGCAGKGCWPHRWIRSLSRGGPGGHCRYPEDRVPPCTSFKSRQRLPPLGWGQLRGCHVSPRLWLPPPVSGQVRGLHVPPRLRLRAALGPPCVTWAPAPTFWLRAAPELTHVPRTGSAGCKQLNKYPPRDPAIMISTRACARVSSKALRDKGCSSRSQGVQQAAH
jgi:hypothetical protein